MHGLKWIILCLQYKGKLTDKLKGCQWKDFCLPIQHAYFLCEVNIKKKSCGKLTSDKVESLRKMWERIYKNGIQMILEGISNTCMNFLDFTLQLCNEKLILKLRNKNNNPNRKLIHFIPKSNPKIQIDTLIGMFKKCIKAGITVNAIRAILSQYNKY